MLLVDPDAAIPVVQVSLQKNLDPALHLAAGRALASLRDEGVLIVGSGMSFHNMRGFGGGFEAASERFDHWLGDAVEQWDPEQRDRLLAQWLQAPDARTCHPREEHLLPLMVVAGAGGSDPGRTIFNGKIPNVTISAYRFG
jgi:aromatic ring-opening dioxygenase catalytic subunit (LigB family)